MPSRPPRLFHRLVDGQTGAEICRDLPHPHKTKVQVQGFQPGAAAGTVVGKATVPLFSPWEREWLGAKPIYDLLDQQQRLETYLGAPCAGQPVFSGVVRGVSRPDAGWSLTAHDSLVLLEKTIVLPTEGFDGTTDALAGFALNADKAYVADDFSSGFSGWTLAKSLGQNWAAGTDEGLPCAQVAVDAGGGGGGQAVMWKQLAAAAFQQTFVMHAWGHLDVSHTTDTPSFWLNIGSAGTIFPAYEIRAGVSISNHGENVTFELNGFGPLGPLSFANSINGALVFPTTQTDFRVWLTLIGTVRAGLTTLRLLVNGADTGLSQVVTGTLDASAGAYRWVGLRAYNSSSDPTGLVKADWFLYLGRSPAFVQGTIDAGARHLRQMLTRSNMLDLLNLSATAELTRWRKTPRAGLNQDQIDWGAAVTEDRSSMRFDRMDGTLLSSTLDENEDSYGNLIELNGSPGGAGGGLLMWPNAAGINKYGPVHVSESVPAVSDLLGLRGYAYHLVTLRSQAMQAKAVTVPWRPDRFALTPGTVNGWREQSLVTVNDPRKNINSLVARVIGWTLDETKAEQVLSLDQLWAGTVGPIERMRALLDALGNRGSDRSLSVPGGLGFDFGLGSPNVIPYGGQPQTITTHAVPAWNAGGNLRLRFPIPSFYTVPTKVAVSFHLDAPVAGAHLFLDGTDITTGLGGPWAGAGDFGEFDVTNSMNAASSWHEFQIDATTGGVALMTVWLYGAVRPF